MDGKKKALTLARAPLNVDEFIIKKYRKVLETDNSSKAVFMFLINK